MESIVRLGYHLLNHQPIYAAKRQNIREIGLHWHRYCELIYFEAGSAVSTINGREMPLNACTLYLLTPVDWHCTRQLPDCKGVQYVNISFLTEILDAELSRKLDGAYYISRADEQCAQMIDLLLHSDDFSEKKHLLHALLYRVARRENKMVQGKNDAIHPAIRQAIRYIADHFQAPITLKIISDDLHLTPAYFSELFSHTMGCPFKTYLTNYRMAYAKELLRYTEKSVNEISLLCGFSNSSCFFRCFKKSMGLTPLAYRAHQGKQE